MTSAVTGTVTSAVTGTVTSAVVGVPRSARRTCDDAVVDDFDPATSDLYAAARTALEQAYCPYSGYPVGAAVRTTSGTVHVGCNVENAAYPLGSCAEAGALAAMVLAGERAVSEVVTVTAGPVPGTPCGGCRQRIREFAAPSTPVHSTTVDGVVVSMTVEELLPSAFGPDHLGPLPRS